MRKANLNKSSMNFEINKNLNILPKESTNGIYFDFPYKRMSSFFTSSILKDERHYLIRLIFLC